MDYFNVEGLDFEALVAAEGLLGGSVDNGLPPMVFEYHEDMDAFFSHMNHELNNSVVQEVQIVHSLPLEPLDTPESTSQVKEVESDSNHADTLDPHQPMAVSEGKEEIKVTTGDGDVTVSGGADIIEKRGDSPDSAESETDPATHQERLHPTGKNCVSCGRWFQNNTLLYLHGLTFHPDAETMDYEGLESEFLTKAITANRKSSKRSNRSRRSSHTKNKKADDGTVSDSSAIEPAASTEINGDPKENDLKDGLQNLALGSTQEPRISPATMAEKSGDDSDEGIDLALPETISILGKRKIDPAQTSSTCGDSQLQSTNAHDHDQNQDMPATEISEASSSKIARSDVD